MQDLNVSGVGPVQGMARVGVCRKCKVVCAHVRACERDRGGGGREKEDQEEKEERKQKSARNTQQLKIVQSIGKGKASNIKLCGTKSGQAGIATTTCLAELKEESKKKSTSLHTFVCGGKCERGRGFWLLCSGGD